MVTVIRLGATFSSIFFLMRLGLFGSNRLEDKKYKYTRINNLLLFTKIYGEHESKIYFRPVKMLINGRVIIIV